MTDKSLCGRKNRRGEPCRNPAGKGTNHLGMGPCKHHGGAAPQVEKAYADRLIDTRDLTLGQLERVVQVFAESEDVREWDDKDRAFLERLHRSLADRSGHGPSSSVEHSGPGGGGIEFIVRPPRSHDDDEEKEEGGE